MASRAFGLLRRRGPALLGGGVAAAACAYSWNHQEALSLQLPFAEEKNGTVGQYRVGKILGEGAFAIVRLCTSVASGEQFALKMVDKAKSDPVVLEQEVAIMKAAGRHRHLVSLVDALETSGA